eukprot:6070604-Pyramimonas_sp.AAC.1
MRQGSEARAESHERAAATQNAHRAAVASQWRRFSGCSARGAQHVAAFRRRRRVRLDHCASPA